VQELNFEINALFINNIIFLEAAHGDVWGLRDKMDLKRL
jgi:hypothetical protein